MFLNIIIALLVAGIVIVIFVPSIRCQVEKWLGVATKEGFSEAGQTMTGQSILHQVGKHPLQTQPMYTDDPNMGNARKDLSRLPSTENGGFSLPNDYNNYRVPLFSEEYKLARMPAPRASEYYHSPRSDAFHLYYKELHQSYE